MALSCHDVAGLGSPVTSSLSNTLRRRRACADQIAGNYELRLADDKLGNIGEQSLEE